MTNIPIATMSFPNRMVVGPGALARLPDEVRALGATRILVVSDPGLERAGVVAQICDVLKAAGLVVATYLGVTPNPIERDVLDGVLAYRDAGAQLIIGLGGGAALDVAKAIRLKIHHHQPLLHYDDLKNGAEHITVQQPPMIAIPTTAGTGSEVGRSSVIVIKETTEDGTVRERKVVIFSPHMLPNVALLDANLTLNLPAQITAATGIDALTHALEAYVAIGHHPFADMFALSALTRIGHYLPRVLKDGHDSRARHEMLLAAAQGAIAFQKGLGGCHALAHPLSAVAGLHHGLANAIMLPHVVAFNLGYAERRYAVAARALGATFPTKSTQKAKAATCLSRVQELIACGPLAPNLASAGVKHGMLDDLVAQALDDACRPQNPRPMLEADIRKLYLDAF